MIEVLTSIHPFVSIVKCSMKEERPLYYINEAAEFLAKLDKIDAAEVLEKAESDFLEMDENWNEGETIVIFEDGSKIAVNGNDVTLLL